MHKIFFYRLYKIDSQTVNLIGNIKKNSNLEDTCLFNYVNKIVDTKKGQQFHEFKETKYSLLFYNKDKAMI